MFENMFDFGYLWSTYTDPFSVGVQAIGQGGDYVIAGVILILAGVFLWAFTAFIAKITVFDVVFPRLQTMDRYKNRTIHTRLFFRTKPLFVEERISKGVFKKTDDDYYWCKFKLFPIVEWHKIAVPRNIRRKRFPWTITLYTERTNLMYDRKKDAWNLTDEKLSMETESLDYYKEAAMHNVSEIADNVLLGVKGDYGLIKDKFKLGLSVQKTPSEKDEDGEEDAAEST